MSRHIFYTSIPKPQRFIATILEIFFRKTEREIQIFKKKFSSFSASVQILGLLVVAGQEFNMDDFVAGQEFNMDDQEIVNFPLETADVQTTGI